MQMLGPGSSWTCFDCAELRLVGSSSADFPPQWPCVFLELHILDVSARKIKHVTEENVNYLGHKLEPPAGETGEGSVVNRTPDTKS